LIIDNSLLSNLEKYKNERGGQTFAAYKRKETPEVLRSYDRMRGKKPCYVYRSFNLRMIFRDLEFEKNKDGYATFRSEKSKSGRSGSITMNARG
jgi:hypothetical protein